MNVLQFATWKEKVKKKNEKKALKRDTFKTKII